LDQLGVQHIIAPYEADPQLTYLLRSGQVSAIITEDSDLLTYGNSNVLFKMDTGGWGKTIDYNEICPYISTHLKKEKINIKTNANVKFTPDMFRYSCIMAGCDYLPSLPGYGLKKAEEFVAQYDAIYKASN
jgi:exonuclease-1